jgi:hypothetical protein
VKKKGLPAPGSPGFDEAVKDNLEVITGRRNNRLMPATILSQPAAGAPTQAEYDALRRDVVAVNEVLTAVLARLDM